MNRSLTKTARKLVLSAAAIAFAGAGIAGIGETRLARANTGDGTFHVLLSYETLTFTMVADNGQLFGTAEASGLVGGFAKNPNGGGSNDGVRVIAAGHEPAICDVLQPPWGSPIAPMCDARVTVGSYDFADVMACREAIGGGCGAAYKQDNMKFILKVKPGDDINAFVNLWDDDNDEEPDDLCIVSKKVAGMTFENLMNLNSTHIMAMGFNGTAACIVTFRLKTLDVPFHKAELTAPPTLDFSGSAHFEWTPGDGTKFRLQLGSTPGGSNIFDKVTYDTDLMVTGLPAYLPHIVYVRLSAFIAGKWEYTDYYLRHQPKPAP
jgi:hypothetical protein